jgi:hypothetical protein
MCLVGLTVLVFIAVDMSHLPQSAIAADALDSLQ